MVLHVANWGGAEELKSEESIVKKFEEDHPNVKVQFETIPTGFKEKILTSISAGNPPDVFLLDSVIMPAFINHGVLVDLMPYVKRKGIDLNKYFPNVLKIAMRDSSLYALPKDFNPLLMYYNKDLFDEAGVPYPQEGWTWKDFVDICKKLTKDTNDDGLIDQYGTAFSTYFYLWQPWVWINGGDILSPDGTSALGYFNSPETIEAAKFLVELKTKYNVTPDAQALTGAGMITSLFFTGKVATVISGHWLVMLIKKYLDEGRLRIGAVHIPLSEHGQRVTVMYEAGWCVPKGVAHEELAVDLAIFLSSEYAAKIRAPSGVALPAMKNIAYELLQEDPYGIEQAFINEVQYIRLPWGTVVEDFRRLELIAKDALDAVIIQNRDIHQAFNETALEMDKELVKYSKFQRQGRTESGRTHILSFLFAVLLLVAVLVAIFIFVAKGKQRQNLCHGLKFLSPSLILLLVFIVTPVIFSLYLSVHQWNVINPEKPFVGLGNFIGLLHDRTFWNAMKNTALFTLQVPLGMAISLLVALMMNQRLKGVNFLRTLFFLPSVSSFVAIAMVWQWLYHPQFGLANFILHKLGVGTLPWLTDPNTALISIMIVAIWMGIGYQMVIFLAGLQGIPEFLYEAALIDGASVWQRFRYVTFPMLTPTTFFVLVTSIIGSFQVFTIIYVMTEGGPSRSTDVVVYHIYRNAWEYLKMGEASAMSWTLFVVILIATWVQFKLIGKQIQYS